MTKIRVLVTVSMTLMLAFGGQILTAQTAPDSATMLRTVRDNTIVSPELPKADLIFGNGFRYIGGQQVNLYSMADAEQHLFVKDGKGGVVDAFYWVQFEHRVPTDQHTYNYPADHRPRSVASILFTT